MMTIMCNGNYINKISVMIIMTKIMLMTVITGMILTVLWMMGMQTISTLFVRIRLLIMITR